MRDARRQASEKPRRRKPRGEFAPTLVSIYGEFAVAAWSEVSAPDRTTVE
jgi:hypothetical protein